MPPKNPKFNIKLKYKKVFEISIILTIILVITAFKYFPEIKHESNVFKEPKPFIFLVDIPETGNKQIPPPPPKPIIPIEIPDDDELPDIEVLQTDLIDNDFVPKVIEEKNEEIDYGIIFKAVEEMPELIGGIASIQKNIVYPEIAKRAGVQGKVTVKVIVNKLGKVENPIILKGIGAGCDEAAIAAIMKTKFKPGRQRGKPVNVEISIPVYFKLN